jgi:hypothetical protein
MAEVVVLMHVVRQYYLVVPAALTRPKGLDAHKKLGVFIIKMLNKKGLKKHSRLSCGCKVPMARGGE